MGTHTERIVVLVDMDCFYCQVEEKLDPSLVGKPIAVAQYNAWKGGGLIAVNYPARDKGVTRHMRGDEAKEICPDIMLVRVPQVRGKADLTKYREGGKRVAEVLQTFTPLLQRASIDEAYLDITEAVENRLKTIGRQVTKQDVPNTYVVAWDSTESYIDNIYSNDYNNEHNLRLLIGGVIVEEIRAAVYEKTGYRCSAGVAHNKILAKLVCGINKPNKQTLLPHESVEEMYKTLPIKKIKGLGAKFGNTLAEDLKIKYMSELAQFSERDLLKRYDDKTANFLYNIARGINLEPVEVRLVSKSIGCCKRFPGKTALVTTEDVTHWLSELAEELSERLEQDIQENNRKAKQIVLSFAQEINKKDIHSSRTITLNSYEAKKITEDAFETLKRYTQKPDGSFVIKFLGLSAGKFENMKNVNEITSFFKNINKNENGPTENQNNFNKNFEATKKPNDLTTLFKNMNKNSDQKVTFESQNSAFSTQSGPIIKDKNKNLRTTFRTKNSPENPDSPPVNEISTLKNQDGLGYQNEHLENLNGDLGNLHGDFQNQKETRENQYGYVESEISDRNLNIPKSIASFLQNLDNNLKTDRNNFENVSDKNFPENDSQIDIFDSEHVENRQNDAQENKNRNILSYFDKTLDPSQNFNSTQTPKSKKLKQKSFFMNFFNDKKNSSEPETGHDQKEGPNNIKNAPQTNLTSLKNNQNHSVSNYRYQNIFGKENFLNLSNIDELNLNDIENDAQNLSDKEVSEILMNQSTFHEDSFSNSTIEGDYDELLLKKEEFPFKSEKNIDKTENLHTGSVFSHKKIENTKQNSRNPQKIVTSKKTSPVLGKNASGTKNSFFMRYLKKMESKTKIKSVQDPESSKSVTVIENYDMSSSDSCQSYESVKNDSVESNEFHLNYKGFEPVPGSSKDDVSEIYNENSSESNPNDRSVRNNGFKSVRFETVPGRSKDGGDDIYNENSSDSCQSDRSFKNMVQFIPVAGTSKVSNQNYNYDNNSLYSCQNDSLSVNNDDILPVETVYSQNSDASTNFDESIEICSECGENVPKNLLISHTDHHLALKLMDEEKKLFKQEFELAKQRRMNKSPTVPELIKSRLKNKSVKRKQPENNTNITSFFVQKTEDNLENTEICSECGKSIKTSDFSSHLDFHAAKKLHLELNPVKVVAKDQFKVTSNKKCNNKNVVNNSNCTLTNFFKPK